MEGVLKFCLRYFSLLLTAIFVTALVWLVEGNETIHIKYFLFITFPLALLSLMLGEQLVRKHFNPKEMHLPKLKVVQEERCIFEPSDLFSSQAFVSLYHVDQTEKFIGYGKIETVLSNNNNLQVEVMEFIPNYDFERLSQLRKNIILKPTLPMDEFQKLFLSPWLKSFQENMKDITI